MEEKTKKKKLVPIMIAAGVLVAAVVIALIVILPKLKQNKQLVAISVEQKPSKLTYHLGEDFDPEGMVVMATFFDGSKQDITKEISWNPERFEEEGTQEITLVYDDRITLLTVEVCVPTGAKIKDLPKKVKYNLGEDLSLVGLTLTALYDDGTTETITSGFETDVKTLSTPGKQEVLVLYRNIPVTFEIEVGNASLTKIEIAKEAQEKSFYKGDKLDYSGLLIKAYYNDGSESEISEGFSVSPLVLEHPGLQAITISYGVCSTQYEVNVIDVQVNSISIINPPTKTSYYQGDTVDTKGLKLRVEYSNGRVSEISEGISCTPSILNETGNQKISLLYQGKSTSFEVGVQALILENITVRTNPTNTQYLIGDTLETNGLSLIALYNSGKSKQISSGFTCSPMQLTKKGNQEITVSFEEKSTSFNVIVQDVPTKLSVKTLPTKQSYYVDEQVNLSGLVLNAEYSDGTIETVNNGYTYSPTQLGSAGTKTITVTYRKTSTNLSVEVKNDSLKSIEVASKPNKTSYKVGESLNTTGLSLKANYESGKTQTVSSGYTVDCSLLNKSGNTIVNVDYQGKQASFTVTVNLPNIGDTITFGPYEWQILDRNGTKALIIAKQSVGYVPYNNTYAYVTWSTCSLRTMLNSLFLNQFSSEEQAKIQTTTVKTPKNYEFGLVDEPTTYDKVFLLSWEEEIKYFGEGPVWGSNAAAVCYGSNGPVVWWLRGRGHAGFEAVCVGESGFLSIWGTEINRTDVGVRPALWLDLES